MKIETCRNSKQVHQAGRSRFVCNTRRQNRLVPAAKAAEDSRSPRRRRAVIYAWAKICEISGCLDSRASVLECGCPLPLFDSTTRCPFACGVQGQFESRFEFR